MKKNSYIILALAGMLSMNSCNDDEFLPGNPSMEIKAENADALFGDSLPFTIKASDMDVPLSTLKAQLFYGEEQVSETVIRTKTSGNDYTGKIFVPYYANIPNGKATLKYILQNIHFTTTEMTKELALARPDFPYLTLVDEEGKEYRMERQSMYKYSVTGDFSQKMKAYIKTPKVGENGNELTFGWENGTIEAGSTNAISFSNTEPGNYAIKFNTLTYEAEPFAKLKVNGEDMELVENDIYAIKLTLKKNDILAFEGVPDYDNWWIDQDYFEKQEDGTLKFLPIDGSYQITANGKMKYFSVIALKNGEAAKLQDDGTGAIWAIGTGIGKPSVALSEVGWTPENGLCMPQLTAKKYQLTFIAGVTMKVDDINFKFFHINKWDNGEFKGDAISTTSELVKISSDGNLGLEEGQKFERGGIYRFTVDVTKGNTKAVLTVEKVGKVDLPAPDIFFGNDKMEVTDTDIYKSDQAFTQGQMITVTGIDNLNEWWIDPDFFEKQSDGALKFLPINGDYRVTANAVLKYFSVMALKDGKPAKLQDDGTGAIWAIGKGIGKPSVTSSEVGWEPSKALCLAQVASKKYQLTLKAGETLKTSGDPEVISFKFFHQNDWGGEFGNYASSILVEQLKLADSGNLEIQDNKAFEEGAVYRFTIDVTNGNANADLKVEKIN